MGLGVGMSRCSSETSTSVPQARGNPNPQRFHITHHEKHGRFLIIEVLYPDCTNFEGRKILVFEGVSWNKVAKAASLDPHFCDNPDHLNPVARFVPTVKGWNFARAFCKAVP